MKIGYKGTDKDMKCKGDTQFELGRIYYIDHDNKIQVLPEGYTAVQLKQEIELCSNTAIHYCNELKNVFPFYSNNGTNRFFKVEIIGEFIDGDSKSGARCIRFVEEITQEELKEMKRLKDEEILDLKMHIPTIRQLQSVNPFLIVGGSIALYLHGVRLDRFQSSAVIDYDLCIPFFQLLQGGVGLKIDSGLYDKGEGYDSDFETAVTVNGVKADLRIDPKQRYEIVEYKGFAYKVTPLETIIRAKAEYAHTKWGQKHKDDLLEMILGKK